MPSWGKLFISVLIIVSVFMLALAFAAPNLAERSAGMRAAALLFAGLLLAAILTGVVSSMIKPPQETAPPQARAPEAPKPPEEKAAFDAKAVRMLALLQKEGRLVDFLREDISGFDDRQVGAAVRNIHKECAKALAEHVDIVPVLKEREGDGIAVAEGFDPSALRLTGNVAGASPFKGIVRHTGWRAAATRIPPLPKNQDHSIIEPAEVEVL